MPSIVWSTEPRDAYYDAYEYDAQRQFVREADGLLNRLYRLLNSDANRFSTDERSVRKAVWLLHMDSLDSLRESLAALESKRHRVTAQLFRTAVETMDLAAFFAADTLRSRSRLKKWYADEVVPNREYRDFLKKTVGEEAATRKAQSYSDLSRLTHRTYGAILYGYSVGAEDRLVHDGTAELVGHHDEAPTMLVVPQTISICFALLADLILILAAEISRNGTSDADLVEQAISDSFEPATVPRRFLHPKEVYRRFIESQDE